MSDHVHRFDVPIVTVRGTWHWAPDTAWRFVRSPTGETTLVVTLACAVDPECHVTRWIAHDGPVAIAGRVD